MLWARGTLTRDRVRSIEQLFREQAAAFDPGGQMLLVGIEAEWPTLRLWVCVPEAELLIPYYGLSPCTRRSLPVAPTLIAGCPRRFGQVFHGL